MGALIDHYDAVDPARMLASVRPLLPDPPARIGDIGAGTGRDAAWLQRQGYAIVAVEPAAALRAHGSSRRDPAINWFDDRLPDLTHLAARRERFDALLLNGVWHHLDAAERRTALSVLCRLLAPKGLILLRVRAGPTAPGRGGVALPLAGTLAHAAALGLVLELNEPSAAFSAAKRAIGVSWTWLALRRA